MLTNAYLLAKIGADTAENEQHFAEILPIGRCVADRRKRDFLSGINHWSMDVLALGEAVPSLRAVGPRSVHPRTPRRDPPEPPGGPVG